MKLIDPETGFLNGPWIRSSAPVGRRRRLPRLLRLIIAETIAFLVLAACVGGAFVGAALVGAL